MTALHKDKKDSIISELEGLGINETEEAIEHIENNSKDFKVDGFRFISKENIDDIMEEDLLRDTYMLGCFNAVFIADICQLDLEIVETAQKNESFELLGAMMAKDIDIVVSNYVSSDGYGHYFAHYDGNEHDITGYYAFKIS